MPQRECLTEAELSAYQLGELPEERQIEAAEHLKDCPPCAAALARLDDLTDGVIAALRQFPPSISAKDCRLADLPCCENVLMDTSPVTQKLTPQPQPPSALANYEVLEEIGRGGMGVVYKARQVRLNRIVALKMVLAGDRARHSELTRFLVEAEMVGRLDHPNIVQIHEVGAHEGRPFIALEYVPGGTLADQLKGQSWPVRPAVILMEKLARAIYHAHQHGIVHRDLKPANILLAADNSPKITDFGLAKMVEAGPGLTTSGAVLGTPAYMAPEQAQGASARVGPCSDIFALGVILYELLAGTPPFRGDTPMDILLNVATKEPAPLSRIQPGLPRDLCTICQHCLEKDPRRRYASAGALAEDLSRFLAGEPIRARPVGELERAWKWSKRRPAVAALLLAVAVILLSWGGTSTYLLVDARNNAEAARSSESEAKLKTAEAKEAAERAQEATVKAVTAQQASESSLGMLAYREGEAAAQVGKIDRGLHLMLQAVRSAPKNQKFQRVVRASMASYAERLPVLREILVDQGPRSWFLGQNGDYFITTARTNELQRWDTRTATKVGPPSHPLGGEVRALSGDGRWAVIRGEGKRKGGLYLVDTTRKKEDKSLGMPLGPYTFIGFASASDVAWVTQADTIEGKISDVSRLFDLNTGNPIGPEFTRDFRLFRARGRTIEMSFPHPNGAEIAAAASFKILLGPNQPPRASWEPDLTGGDSSVQFDGQSIVTLGREGLVRWWNPVTGKQTKKPWRPARVSRGDSGVLLAGGRTMIMLRTDGRLCWYDLASCQDLPISLPSPRNLQLAVRPDGTALLLGSADQPLRLWRVENLPSSAGPDDGDEKFYKVAYSPKRDLVYTGTRGVATGPYGVLSKTTTGQPIQLVLSPAIYGPVFSQDGRVLATHSPAVGNDYRVEIRTIDTGQLVGNLDCPKLIHGLAMAPDNRTLAAGYIGGTRLVFLDLGLAMSLDQTAPVSELLFSPDSKWLATGSLKGWGINEPSCFRVWEVKRAPVSMGSPVGNAQSTADAPRFAFSSDSKILFTFEHIDGRLRRWEVGATLKQLGKTIELHKNIRAEQSVFSKDGRLLLTGYLDGRARLWIAETETRKPLGDAMSHPAAVTSLAFSPRSDRLAIGCDDGSVWLRDADTGLAIGPPTLHCSAVRGLAFSADGKNLLSTSANGVTCTRRVPAPLEQPLDALEAWLESSAGTRFDNNDVVLLDAASWRKSRRRLEEIWPEMTAEYSRPANLGRWYDDRTRTAEARRIDCRWELDRLIEIEGSVTPKNWMTRARRAHLDALENRPETLEAAAKEYRSVEAVAREPLGPWYQRCAAEARYAKEWSLARWYLDRAIAIGPNEWRLYEARSAVRSAMGPSEKDGALDDQLEAAERGADHPFLIRLADQLMTKGDFQKANVQLVRDAQRWGFHLERCQRQALIYSWLRQKDKYRSVCSEALEHYEVIWARIPVTFEAASLGWLCTLSPDALSDRQGLGKSLDRFTNDLKNWLPEIKRLIAKHAAHDEAFCRGYSAQVHYDVLYARAAVLHRLGKSEEALDHLKEFDAFDRQARKSPVGSDKGTKGWHRPLLALIYRRLGNTTKAREWREKTDKWLRDNPAGTASWVNRFTVELLLDEYKKLQVGVTLP